MSFSKKRLTELDADPQLGRQGGSKQQMEMAPTKHDQVNAEAGHEYEVFLSFRGPDTRLEFTDNLYHRLKDAGVQTFRDDEELRVGEKIGPELMRAIKQSKISIPIFSKGYASSKWCLLEVAEMVKLKDETKHMIMPIFLDVTPDEVKYQTGSYAEAFTQHGENYDFETVQEWRNALQEVVKLKGLELKKEANGKHGEFIKKVLAMVLNCLKKAYLNVNDLLVGIDDHVEAVKKLLELGKEGVQIVGIWGMGGIGKTTLAKVVYNQLLKKFESSGFLNDIRETSSQHKGLPYLQSKLLSDILNREREDFANTNEGTQELKNRLRDRKAIILLDDVDQVDQLKALAGDLAWFSPESRIIVTTREKTVLDQFRIKNIYELTLLSAEQAFELFCRHAFIKGSPTPDFIDLSWDIVRTTGRLPLALEVIGSSLSTSSGRKDLWQGTLKKLEKKPPKEVQDTLRISYNGLDHEEREIFLDIACFFIGIDARIAKPMWDDCEFFPGVGIEILLLKSLIKIKKDHRLWMHDQLRDLGRVIVEEENYKESRLRSRLWHSKVVMHVLERQPEEGMTNVEAISLEGYQFRSEDLCFKDDQFRNLPNLRILLLDKASLSGNFERIIPNLRWLSWHLCNFNAMLPTNLNLKNLVVLDLSRSMVSEDWAGWSLMKVAAKLKVLDLTECRHLTKTPSFSAFSALEKLILRSCRNLVSVDPSIEQLSALVSLDIRDCTKLEYLPRLGSMDALTELLVDYEVFLSFGGLDDSEGFTDQLYHHLKDVGVHTVRDNGKLRVAEEIGPELMMAIKQSKIYIPILSKGYALSTWCLTEVAEMMKLEEETKHRIMPIFLDVTPNEVQHQTGSYAEAFAQHEGNYDSETVQEWRDALQKVVKLGGLEFKKEANGKHEEFIKKVLARVVMAYLEVNDMVVGIIDHFKVVKTLLELGKEGVQIVGIWGMGGIGKTTLAKVVYSQLLGKFESSCFLNNIRGTSSQPKGLEYLQSKLLSDILNCEREDFANTNEGIQQLKNRLRDKKAIILLDDVDQVDQLKALAGDLAWFSPESRIIVTTRDRAVLNLFRINNTYELTLLSEYQAFELFCEHAFKEVPPTPDFADLSWDIVRAIGRLPLALKVTGSFLSTSTGRKEIWQDTLKQLKMEPHRKVQERLAIIYNVLDREQQEIFLDIACFFIGKDARIAKSMWDDCDFFPEIAIEILLSKSLIKITDDSRLWMHDQLRDLGRLIVEKENYKEPRLRSRLWQGEVAMRVLERQPEEGRTTVEAISLEGYQFRSEDLCFKDDQFKNLPNLRILLLDKASLSGNFEGILPNLRWLSWHFCNFSPTLPTNLNLKNLVVLDLSKSMVSEDWAGWSLMKVAAKLKVLDLTECGHLTRTPGFSAFPALERLILRSCCNLVSVDPSIEQLSALLSLDIRDCTKLEYLPQLGSMDALTELLVDGTSIQELPVLRGTDKLGNLEALGSN
ncbi:uncharacterized protein LOC116198093 isoform X2 [Punica granatum]|uniref:Uncharacterized protein LOC116198093 isoform X2 n=1 Tax=Punica granatum TaxID=22663 RepID=A0A6P8CJG5_PUNGR|nr:uncharacterized protein LOC116198093 isoform X2 [Punica granatum]